MLELDSRDGQRPRTRHPHLYDCCDCWGTTSASSHVCKQRHEEFLDAYRRQQWNEAERALAACREVGIARLETYYSLFASRITALRDIALPSDWDGSFAMTEK